jgi:hypothetical protein
MLEESDSAKNNESFPSKISYTNHSKPRIYPSKIPTVITEILITARAIYPQ